MYKSPLNIESLQEASGENFPISFTNKKNNTYSCFLKRP